LLNSYQGEFWYFSEYGTVHIELSSSGLEFK
jgi:hypothetical protein